MMPLFIEAGMFEKLAKWLEYKLELVLISKKIKKWRVKLDHAKCMQSMQTWSWDIFQSNGPIWKSGIPSWLLELQDHFYDMQWMN